MKTYVFKAEIEQDEDGRWGAEVPSLPGCATQGATREEALGALNEATKAYLEVLAENDQPLPEAAQEEAQVIDSADIVAVTV